MSRNGLAAFPDLDGTWTYTAAMSGSVGATTMTCDMTGFRLSINQSGGSFSDQFRLRHSRLAPDWDCHGNQHERNRKLGDRCGVGRYAHGELVSKQVG